MNKEAFMVGVKRGLAKCAQDQMLVKLAQEKPGFFNDIYNYFKNMDPKTMMMMAGGIGVGGLAGGIFGGKSPIMSTLLGSLLGGAGGIGAKYLMDYWQKQQAGKADPNADANNNGVADRLETKKTIKTPDGTTTIEESKPHDTPEGAEGSGTEGNVDKVAPTELSSASPGFQIQEFSQPQPQQPQQQYMA